MTAIPKDKDNSVYSYMDWKAITNKNSAQYKLRIKYNTYDSNGLADIEGRKVVACTSTFGSIGDEIEVTFEKGVDYFNKQSKTLFAIIGDFKNQNDPNCDKYGHLYGNTQRSVIEFIVDSSKITNIKSKFPGLKNNPVIKIERTGVNFL